VSLGKSQVGTSCSSAPARSDRELIETKEKSFKEGNNAGSFVRKFQSKVKMSPAFAVNVCRIAEPWVAIPPGKGSPLGRRKGSSGMPKLVRLPISNPRNSSIIEPANVAPAVDNEAWEVPWVGPLPNADVSILVSPSVVHPVKSPVSKPPLISVGLVEGSGKGMYSMTVNRNPIQSGHLQVHGPSSQTLRNSDCHLLVLFRLVGIEHYCQLCHRFVSRIVPESSSNPEVDQMRLKLSLR
jgi:hypothetical protein